MRSDDALGVIKQHVLWNATEVDHRLTQARQQRFSVSAKLNTQQHHDGAMARITSRWSSLSRN
jgi:hypothetical protein